MVLPTSQLAPAGIGGRPSGTLGPPQPGCEAMVDMFCRILISVDEDLVSLDIPRCVCVCVSLMLARHMSHSCPCVTVRDGRVCDGIEVESVHVCPSDRPHRSQDESKLSMHVKDSMREHSVADIAAAW